MQETVDRLTLFNLVATVDAWISAGLTPVELLRHLHPARVGNTILRIAAWPWHGSTSIPSSPKSAATSCRRPC